MSILNAGQVGRLSVAPSLNGEDRILVYDTRGNIVNVDASAFVNVIDATSDRDWETLNLPT